MLGSTFDGMTLRTLVRGFSRWGTLCIAFGALVFVSGCPFLPQPACTDAASCNDNDVCTTDTCNADGTCSNTNNTAACDDDDDCTANDVCAAGECAGTAIAGCCADDNDCAANEVCVNNECTLVCTTAADCNDNNVCTTDTCDNGACGNANNTVACDDGDICTDQDVCANGACAGQDVVCTDALFCNGVESCNATTGACDAGTSPCAAGQVCDETNDSCQTGTTCVDATDCDDGVFCNGAETCGANLLCAAGTNPCSATQTCNENLDRCEGGGTTFTLTDEIDLVEGTAGDDTIVGTDTTYTTGDDINGGDGTGDRLNLTTVAAENDLVDMQNVENAFIRNTFNGQAIDIDSWTGYDQLWYDRGNDDLTLENVNEATTIGINRGDGGNSDFNVEFSDDLTDGTADSVDVELTDADAGDVTIENAGGTEGFETINVNVTGDNNLVSLNSTDLETVNITGGSSLVIEDAIVGATTVDASGSIADVDVTADDVDFTYTGGSGADVVRFGEGEFDNDDSVDGGTGDADEVHVALDSSVTVAGAGGVGISNVELLNISGDDDGAAETFTFDLGGVTGLTTIQINGLGAGSTGDTITFDDAALGPNLVFLGDGTDANQVFDSVTMDYSGASGDSDSQAIEFNNDGEDLDENDRTITVGSIDLDDNIESASIEIIDGGLLTLTDLNGDALESLSITANSSLTITNALESTDIVEVDASASTGDVSVSIGNATSDASMVGGEGDDVLTGGAGEDDIDGGIGDDTLTGGADADVLTGGDDSDTFVATTVGGSSLNADAIVDFTPDSGGDIFAFDLSALETAGAVDADEVIDFTELADGTSVAAADAITIHECTVAGGACTPAANANVIVMIGGTIGSTALLETALEAGGGSPLVIALAGGDVTSAFPVVYTDGSDSFVAVCFAETETADDADFEAGDLTCVNLAQLADIDAIATGDFVAANFDYIP